MADEYVVVVPWYDHVKGEHITDPRVISAEIIGTERELFVRRVISGDEE